MQLTLILLGVALPVLCGALLPRLLSENRLRYGVVLALFAECILAGTAAFLPEAGFQAVWTVPGGLALGFFVDGTAKLFSCLSCAVWLLAGLFALSYMAEDRAAPRFYRYYLMTLGAVVGLAYAGNLPSFLVLFEAMTLLSLPLVLHNGNATARKAGLMYLGYSLLGACMVLGGLFLLSPYGAADAFAPGGALDSGALEGRERLAVGLYFAMAIGFGAKAGLFPLHGWLPVAHPEAPSPASAVLSGVITKAGVLGILRLTYGLFGTALLGGSWAQWALLILCLVTVFMGSMMAFREPLLKRRLAYSSVSQISYALLGVLLMTPTGLLGGLLQVVFHAVAKTCLFLWAGAVSHETGLARVDELRGIGRRQPWASWCFALGALSLIGMPPLGGFVSKWFLATGSLAPQFGALGVVSACVLILSALLTAGYLLPVCMRAFFPGEEFSLTATPACEPGRLMLCPMVALAAALVVLGIFGAPLTNLLSSIGRGLAG